MSSAEIDAASIVNFDLHRVLGLWHIYTTNLNMWKGRLSPTITYSIHDRLPDGRVRINDLVEYYTKRPLIGFIPSDLKGIDTQSKYKPSRFQWRGDGVLKPLTSQFGFVFVDNETPVDQPYQWVATMFGSTPFSSAGIDFMTRTRQPSMRVLNDFVRLCQNHPILASKSKNMFFTRETADDPVYYIRDLRKY